MSDISKDVREAAARLQEFNEKSDVAIETIQPLAQQYVALLRALQTEVVQLNARAANCTRRAKNLAAACGVDVSHLKLGQHDEELEREEKAEYEKKPETVTPSAPFDSTKQ